MNHLPALTAFALSLMLCGRGEAQTAPVTTRVATEIRRIASPEARQGVAADQAHLYVIDNRTIGKYSKETWLFVSRWQGDPEGPIQHLNAGMVREGRLYAASSNYPKLPMISSIEVWDVETMRHVGSHSFGIHSGSATWIDYHDELWWVAFANYENAAGVPGRGVAWSTVELFDEDWRQVGGYVFPEELVEKFRPFSNSGGVWVNGELWLTGHDAAEVYVARLPEAGATLNWVATIKAPIEGQGITVDPIAPDVLYAIDRASREVVVVRVGMTRP
jgi:hypothetical protein